MVGIGRKKGNNRKVIITYEEGARENHKVAPLPEERALYADKTK